MTNILNCPNLLPEKSYDIKNAVVFLHGYGANGNDLINIGHQFKNQLKHTAFISPNAPFKCEWNTEAYQWFDLTSIAPEKIGEGLEKAGPFLNNFIEEIKKKYSLVDNQIVFFGFSQGAMMALYHLCKRKNKCAGLLAYSGLLYTNENFDNEINVKFPVRIFHGREDEIINSNYSTKAFEKLKSLDFDVELKIEENLGHGINENGLISGYNFIKGIFNV